MHCPCMPNPSPSGHSSVKLGVLTTPCRRRSLKSPGVWHQIINYDGAGELLGERLLPSKGGRNSKTDLDYLMQVGSRPSSPCLYIAAVLVCAY